MRVTRLFCPFGTPWPGQVITLPEGPGRHLLQVLRAKPGEQLQLFNGAGTEWLTQLSQASRREAKVEFLAPVAALPAPGLRLTLAQGIARGDRMDFVVQKAVELGVSKIVPLLTERCGVRYPDAQRALARQQHWREVAISACEQSGRADLPEITTPQPLSQWLAEQPGGLLMQPDAVMPITALHPPHPVQAVQLLVGPEGGFSEAEIQLAQLYGASMFRLGPRILRTETAGLAALAALQTLWGDFGDYQQHGHAP